MAIEYIINKAWKIWESTKDGCDVSCYQILKGNTGTGSFFQVTRFPTDNCQWGSIGSAKNILKSSNAKEILQDIHSIWIRPMWLFDLPHNYQTCLEALFPAKDIVLKSPYISTNGSHMTLYLVKSDSLNK